MTRPAVSRSSAAVLIVTAVAASALLVSRRSYVPMWDGWIYAQCIADVGRNEFALPTLRCADHISYASMSFYGLFQLLSPGSFTLMLVAAGVVYALACAAFFRVTQLAHPGPEHLLERAFLTAIFALHPAVLASVVQPNIDLPMLPAFLWAVVFIIRRRWLPLVLVGCALVMTKESGVLLYVSLLFAFALAMVMPHPSSSRSPISALLRLFPLALPVALFGVYLAYRIIVPHKTVLQAAGTTEQSILYQFLVPRIDPYFISYSAIIFLMSFAWVPTGVIAVDAAVAVVRRWRKLPPRPLSGSKRRVVRFVIVLGVVTIYALTRYSSYANTRYLLPVFAVLPLMMYGALVRLRVNERMRRSFLAALAGLTLASTVLTIDPVSRVVFGTFQFGDRSMLRMTSITHECCGSGQDQLAHSLQFTALSDLMSDITEKTVDDSTAIVVPPRMTWQTVGALDPTTHRRTLEYRGAIVPLVLGADTLAKVDSVPRRAVYIGLPNGDVARGLKMLDPYYDVAAPEVMRRGPYSMPAYRLTRRVTRP